LGKTLKKEIKSEFVIESVSRRKSMAPVLGVASLGLALGKRSAFAKGKTATMDPPPVEMTEKEKAFFLKLKKAEQSKYSKLNHSERSVFQKE
jgi:hypothetical protein